MTSLWIFDLFSSAPCPGHETLRLAGENPQRAGEIALAGLCRFERGKIAEDLLLSARNQRFPVFACRRILLQRRSEPRRHRMSRSASVFRIKADFHFNSIAHASTGCF